MPVIYNCPHTVWARGFDQILCGMLLKDGKIPQTLAGKAQACCAHQYYCPMTQRWEHTHGCTKCAQRKTGGDG